MTVEIRAAPDRLLWSVDGVRIGQVCGPDGQRRRLPEPVALALPALPPPVLLVDSAGHPVVRDAWRVPIAMPKKPREVAGTIDCRFLLHHPCITIGDPRSAIGKRAVGMRGVQMTVVKMEREEDAVYLTVQIARTSDLLAAGPSEHVQRARPGVIITRSPLTALLDGLELRDAQHRSLPRVGLERLDDASADVVCRAAFRDVPADAKGLRLVLAAWLTVRVEVEYAVRAP